MNKVLYTSLICLIITGLYAQASWQNGNHDTNLTSCEQTILTYGEVTPDLDQHTIANVARCHAQLCDNLLAARWYEKIADLENCRPEYLLEYGQCLKSLNLYGKAKFYFQKYAQHDPVAGNHFMQSCDIAKMLLEGDLMFDVKAIPANSLASEYAPIMTGSNLIFNAWGTEPAPVFTVSDFDGENVKRTSGENQKMHGITHVRYSGNGDHVVYSSNLFSAGQRLYSETPGSKIFVAEVVSNSQWSEPVVPAFCSDAYSVGYPTLTHSGEVMYFASNMPGGKGGWDIYVSRKIGSTWSSPENLGPTINTPGNEISPFIVDNKLYFSSDWHVGIGGFDVFVASLNGNNVVNVRTVGYPVNSPKDDIDFVWDSNHNCAFLASNRIGGAGQYDIYKAVPQYRDIAINVVHKTDMTPVGNAMLTMTPGYHEFWYTNTQGIAITQTPLTGKREIKITREGFVDGKIRLDPNADLQSKYEIYLEPKAENAPSAPVAVTKETTTVKPKVEDPVVRERVVEKPVTPPSQERVPEKPFVKSVPEPVHVTQEGYLVQIAALGRNASLEPFAHLRKYGDLNVKDGDKYSKVRVGIFSTESEARTALARIKADGFPDAFVVMDKITYGSSPQQSSPALSQYKVRLGTYARVGSFDPSRVEHLGSLESYRKDDLTIMLLSGYSDLASARRACVTAAQNGFTDAYVVMDNDGVLKKVHD